MTWKPVTGEPVPGVGTGHFLWCNLTIPKLWAICQETSTQSRRPKGPTQTIAGVSASPRLAPDCTLPLLPPEGTPGQPIGQPAYKGKVAKRVVFTNLIYQSFKKKKSLLDHLFRCTLSGE